MGDTTRHTHTRATGQTARRRACPLCAFGLEMKVARRDGTKRAAKVQQAKERWLGTTAYKFLGETFAGKPAMLLGGPPLRAPRRDFYAERGHESDADRRGRRAPSIVCRAGRTGQLNNIVPWLLRSATHSWPARHLISCHRWCPCPWCALCIT